MKTATPSPLDRMFRAFSDATRLRILNLLVQGELCVCDIVNTLGLPQPTVSRHLGYLRSVGLVEVRREGTWMHYKLATLQSAHQQKLLECVGNCLRDVPQYAKDAKRLTRSKCC